MSTFNELDNEFTGDFYQTEPLSSNPRSVIKIEQGTVLCLATSY